MQFHEEVFEPAAAVQPRRHKNFKLVGNRDGAAIESVMVDVATGQAVVGRIRAAELKPADVGCFQSQVGVVQLHGVTAERAVP